MVTVTAAVAAKLAVETTTNASSTEAVWDTVAEAEMMNRR